MRTLSLAVFLCLAAFAGLVTGARSEPVADSVVHIQVFDPKGSSVEPIKEGSGFVVHPVGIIVTARHLLLDKGGNLEKDLVFKVGGSREDQHFRAYPEAADEEADIAILSMDPNLEKSRKRAWSPLCIDTQGDPTFDQVVSGFGFTTKGAHVSNGVVSSGRMPNGLYSTDIDFAPMMSGGPIMNEHKDKVVGVITGNWRDKNGPWQFNAFTGIRPAVPLVERVATLHDCRRPAANVEESTLATLRRVLVGRMGKATEDRRRGTPCSGDTLEADIAIESVTKSGAAGGQEFAIAYRGDYKRQGWFLCARVGGVEALQVSGQYRFSYAELPGQKPAVALIGGADFGEIPDGDHDSNRLAVAAAKSALERAF